MSGGGKIVGSGKELAVRKRNERGKCPDFAKPSENGHKPGFVYHLLSPEGVVACGFSVWLVVVCGFSVWLVVVCGYVELCVVGGCVWF